MQCHTMVLRNLIGANKFGLLRFWETCWLVTPVIQLDVMKIRVRIPRGRHIWAVLVVVLLKPTQEVIQPGIIPQTVHQINV